MKFAIPVMKAAGSGSTVNISSMSGITRQHDIHVSCNASERAVRTLTVLGAFLSLAIVANAFAAYFITQEHYVYYWDYSGYWLQYLDIGSVLVQHPIAALRAVISSVRHSDYNVLPVLPLIPFELLFGTSRLTYILAITNVLLLPAALVIAFLAQRMSPAKRSLSRLVLATASILILHPLWIPVLQGLPDVVGVVVVGSILLLHFAKPLAEQKWNSLLATGLLLCLLMLLRRWYAFWVVAFFPALAVAQGLDIYQRHGLAWRHYVAAARGAVIIGLTFLISLFGLATPFALRAITTDYSDIYSGWRFTNSLVAEAVSLVSYVGWLGFVGGLTGVAWLAGRMKTRVMGTFLLTQSFTIFVTFERTQNFDPHYYYLLFPAIALGLAITVIAISTWNMNVLWRAASIAALFTALLTGSSTVMNPEAAPISDILGRLAPNYRYYPLVRNDLDVLDSLLDHLGELESRQRGDIYVLASSEILNSSIVQNYCRLGPQRRSFCDRILVTNDVDKRDGFPHQFLRASYLIVASPTQYHLRPDDQRVIGVLAREVMKGHGIGGSFQRLSREFELEQGITAWVETKVRPLERMDLDALAAEFARYYPDKQPMFSTTDE